MRGFNLKTVTIHFATYVCWVMAILARKTLFDSFIKIEITYTNLFSSLYNVQRQCDWTHFPSNLLN